MRRVKAVIVDDERLARVNIKTLLEQFPDIEVVGEADSIKSAIEIINFSNPQLIFLDIQLRSESGFELLEKIDNSIKVIFVTAFDEYAIRAFEVNATDYILKPVNPERLKLSLDRIIHKENVGKSNIKNFQFNDSIYVKLNNSTSNFIKISSIIFIASIGNYSKIFTDTNKHYLVLKTLKQWQQELPDSYFIRIHRSTIINIEQIERIENKLGTPYKMFLKSIKEPLEISRRFASNLKALN